MLYYCYWKNNKYCSICFAWIKVALIKRYHLHMYNRVLLWFGKFLQWNLHVNRTIFENSLRFQGCLLWNCHVNGITFQSGLRFQTGLSSLLVSCKCVLSLKNLSPGQFFRSSNQLTQISLNFKACCCNLKIRMCVAFLLF